MNSPKNSLADRQTGEVSTQTALSMAAYEAASLLLQLVVELGALELGHGAVPAFVAIVILEVVVAVGSAAVAGAAVEIVVEAAE